MMRKREKLVNYESILLLHLNGSKFIWKRPNIIDDTR